MKLSVAVPTRCAFTAGGAANVPPADSRIGSSKVVAFAGIGACSVYQCSAAGVVPAVADVDGAKVNHGTNSVFAAAMTSTNTPCPVVVGAYHAPAMPACAIGTTVG